MNETFSIATGTATICVFDQAALHHRVNDYADWWSDEDEELKEVNAGNVIFVALGADGRYELEVRSGRDFESPQQETLAFVRCPSGRVFVGPGEDVTGGELEPDRRDTSGRTLLLAPGSYRVQVCRLGAWKLGVSFQPTKLAARNALSEGLSLIA
jgi:hypothetical protein